VIVNPNYSLNVPPGLNLSNASIGVDGFGVLRILDAGDVEAHDFVVAAAAGSTGTVTLEDPQAKLIILGPLTVGLAGNGTIKDTGGLISTQQSSLTVAVPFTAITLPTASIINRSAGR
jgi:T5SS/PEP-CTERM-associated repeat protein